MNVQKCLEMLREIRDVVFATVDEEGKPQARIIDIMLVEDGYLYFCTARGKDFYRQIMRNGNVAIAGMNKNWQTIRLSGKASRVSEQKEWIDKIFDRNSSMNHVYPGESRYILEAFRVDTKQIEFFDLGKTPIVRERFSTEDFGADFSGFVIENGCIGCGKCERICPQKCIDKGTPYKIRQENCLHCGLCCEVCPTHSVKRRKEDDKRNI